MNATAKRLVRKLTRSLGYEVVGFERTLPGHLVSVFERFGVDCVVDVGAHHGEFGVLLREAGYSRQIVSFEPIEESYAALTKAADADAAWTTHRVALGADDRDAVMNVSRSTNFSSFLSATDYSLGLEWGSDTARRERVPVVALDRIADDVIPSGAETLFLKTDTQGWDLHVLRGAERTLDRVAGVQVEMSVKPMYEDAPGFVDTLHFLDERGFEMTALFPVVADAELRLIEFDCVLARITPSHGSQQTAERDQRPTTADVS